MTLHLSALLQHKAMTQWWHFDVKQSSFHSTFNGNMWFTLSLGEHAIADPASVNRCSEDVVSHDAASGCLIQQCGKDP